MVRATDCCNIIAKLLFQIVCAYLMTLQVLWHRLYHGCATDKCAMDGATDCGDVYYRAIAPPRWYAGTPPSSTPKKRGGDILSARHRVGGGGGGVLHPSATVRHGIPNRQGREPSGI